MKSRTPHLSLFALAPALALAGFAHGHGDAADPTPDGGEAARVFAIVDADAALAAADRAVASDAAGPVAPGATPNAAGCVITLKVRNNSRYRVGIDLLDTRVRVRRGFWRAFKGYRDKTTMPVFIPLRRGTRVALDRGDRRSLALQAALGCNARRRYRIHLWHQTRGEHVIYYPSSRTYTRRTTLDLGDLSRFF